MPQTPQEQIADAVATAYMAAINIVLAEAEAWAYMAEHADTPERQAERRHVAGALRRAAAKIREMSETKH